MSMEKMIVPKAVNHNEETRENMLNEWDKKYLLEGGQNVVLKMYEDFNRNFPDVIILPETAARPLYYMFNHIFKKLKQEKGTKIPRFVFFNSGKKSGMTQNTLEREYGENIETTDDFIEKLLGSESHGHIINYLNQDPQEIHDLLVKDAEIEKVSLSRYYMRQRADEVKELIRDKNLNLAILDDYSANGNTANEIKKAFGVDILSYAICGSSDEGTELGYTFRQGDDQWFKEDPNPKTQHWNYSYSKSKSIGVVKNNEGKYTSVLKPKAAEEKIDLAKEKKQIREEMKSLGEEILNRLLFSSEMM